MPNAIRHTLNPMPNIHPARPGVSKADLAVAAQLKETISDFRLTHKLGPTLKGSLAPVKQGNRYIAADGDPLISVGIYKAPSSVDLPRIDALVDPRTNQFYIKQTGAQFGTADAISGPYVLPASVRFTGKRFTATDLRTLEKAAKPAETKPTPVKAPTAREIEGAIGAYRFHNMLNFSAKAPSGAIASKIALKGDKHPDGFNYTALVLKSDPRKVVIQRTGGFAGTTSYSNVIDLNRIPK